MNIESLIIDRYPEGLTYNEAAQLCLSLYTISNYTPEELQPECTMENLALVFSKLAKSSFIKSVSNDSALYGANFHNTKTAGHWIEVIASIFKSSETVDISLGHKLAERLTSQSNPTASPPVV